MKKTRSNLFLTALLVPVFVAPANAAAPEGPAGVRAESPAGEPRRLSWGVPTECVTDDAGKRWRVQCTDAVGGGAKRVCLAAPAELSNGEPLSRVPACIENGAEGYRRIISSRAAIVSAVAEAPPGWYRDEEGHVMQITFDLQRRFFLGAGWEPAFDPAGDSRRLGRSRLDMGFVSAWPDERLRRRHVIRALEGDLVLPDLDADGQLFAYDLSQVTDEPILRITTFFGRPRRGDLRLDWGLGLRVLGLDVRPHGVVGVTDLEIGEFHLAWDLWQSKDLYNRVRLSAGAAVGRMWEEQNDESGWRATYLSPDAAIVWFQGLDRDGFHTVSVGAHWSLPCYYRDGGFVPRTRAGTDAGWEWILIAINDQPLSLRVEGSLDYRDDLGPADPKWEASAHAGLRFSLWAPAREHAVTPVHTRHHADEQPPRRKDGWYSE